MFSLTVNVDGSEESVNERLERHGEVLVGLAHAVVLDRLLKLFDGDLAVLMSNNNRE